MLSQLKKILPQLFFLCFLIVSCILVDVIFPSSDIGYTWDTIISASILSLHLLAIALLWSFIIHAITISCCFFRWKTEMHQAIELVLQLISGVPLFIACLYLSKWQIKANIWWGGLVLAVGDFLLAEIFPILYRKMKRIFTPAYIEALQGRGFFCPLYANIFSWQRWKMFFYYYILVYLREWTQIIRIKIPLFFSAMIVVEKALFYGTDIDGANRGLGSLFFDCILELSEGKNRTIPLLKLGLYSLSLLIAVSILLQIIFYLLGGKNTQRTSSIHAYRQSYAMKRIFSISGIFVKIQNSALFSREFWHILFHDLMQKLHSKTTFHFINGLVIVFIIYFCLVPIYASQLYPWWMLPFLAYIFCFGLFRYYFITHKNILLFFRIFFYICDVMLFVPCAFLIYVIGVQWGIFTTPVFFEKSVCHATQMIVHKNSLYVAESKCIAVKKTSINNSDRFFQTWKQSILFQVRSIEKNTQQESSFHTWLQALEMPKNSEEHVQVIDQLRQNYDNFFTDASKIIKKAWFLKSKDKAIRKQMQEFIDWNFNATVQNVNKKIEPLVYLYESKGELNLYWKEIGTEEENLYKEVVTWNKNHNIKIVVPNKWYTIEIRRYPAIKNVFLEESMPNNITVTIDPKISRFPNSYIRFYNIFKRPSLLGTKGGVRNQDIFLRLVTAFQETYFQYSIPIILLIVCILASWSVLYFIPTIPNKVINVLQAFFHTLQYTTAVPVYVLIGIIFIGIYDGKNFHILFALVGYFLLPSLSQQIYNAVVKYYETYYPTKIAIGFSETTIAYHFITREAKSLYIIYLLYFCANMILFETSFAYLKGGAPSELSLGIFLYAARNQWTIETYATVIVLVSILYFFARCAYFAHHVRS